MYSALKVCYFCIIISLSWEYEGCRIAVNLRMLLMKLGRSFPQQHLINQLDYSCAELGSFRCFIVLTTVSDVRSIFPWAFCWDELSLSWSWDVLKLCWIWSQNAWLASCQEHTLDLLIFVSWIKPGSVQKFCISWSQGHTWINNHTRACMHACALCIYIMYMYMMAYIFIDIIKCLLQLLTLSIPVPLLPSVVLAGAWRELTTDTIQVHGTTSSTLRSI